MLLRSFLSIALSIVLFTGCTNSADVQPINTRASLTDAGGQTIIGGGIDDAGGGEGVQETDGVKYCGFYRNGGCSGQRGNCVCEVTVTPAHPRPKFCICDFLGSPRYKAPVDVSKFFESVDGQSNFPFLYGPKYVTLLNKLTSGDYATVSHSDGQTVYTAVTHTSFGTDTETMQANADFVLRQTVVE